MTTAAPILDMAETLAQRLRAAGGETVVDDYADLCTRSGDMAALGGLLTTLLMQRGLEVPAQTHDETSVRRMLATLLEVTDG